MKSSQYNSSMMSILTCFGSIVMLESLMSHMPQDMGVSFLFLVQYDLDKNTTHLKLDLMGFEPMKFRS